MVSLNGWLEQRGPEHPPRLTESQRDLVARTISQALAIYAKHGDDERKQAEPWARKVVSDALAEYPLDRSCKTCDFLAGQTCQAWGGAVPDEFIEKGCDRWQDDGAPF